ncbi:MAG: carboxymuconolactone decarboxylase family protein [Planctomycetota bacterium]|jgi:alkylhydroperoxidase family enzyme
MPWIQKIEPGQAEGKLAHIYNEAHRRAGKVYEILKLQSLRPDVLEAWLQFYFVVMFGKSGLSRVEREMVATVVSVENGCHY